MLHIKFLDSPPLDKHNAVAAAGIQAAGSIFGGLIGSSGSHYAAQKQLQAVRETNQMNYQIAQANNAFNERMWNLQNQYNSPIAQRQRLEQAGLNPYLMLDGSSTGNAQTAVTADQSGTQVAPEFGSTLAAGYQSLGSSISSAASQIAQMQYNNELQSANVAKAKAEASNVDAQTKFQSLQNDFAVAQFLTDLRLKRIQGDIGQKEYDFLRDSFEDRLESAHYDWYLKGQQSSYYKNLSDLTEIQYKIADTNLRWLPREKQVSIMVAIQNARTAASQMHLNYASARNMIAMAALNAAQESGVRIDNKLKDTIFDLSVGNAENQYEKGRAEAAQYLGGYNLNPANGLVYGLGSSARQLSGKDRTPFMPKHRKSKK